MENKLIQLKTILQEMGSVLVAFSGGTDSTFLAFIAKEVLDSKILAVYSFSAISPPSEREATEEVARKMELRYKIISGNQLNNPDFVMNPTDRCYYCRKDLFRELKEIAKKEGLKWVSDGTNFDDRNDFRPGRKAAEEAGVRSPLLEAGLTKEEIRRLSRKINLPTWDKPASPCLASRIPYGIPVTSDILSKIGEGEKYLHSLGLKQLRLRHHGDIARIELDEQDMASVFNDGLRRDIVKYIKALGYIYVTLDLTGYRTGSLNIGIKQE